MTAVVSEIKSRNRRLLEQERFLRRVSLESLPQQIQIEPTNRCNLACPTCARNYYDPKLNPNGELEPCRYPQLERLLESADRVLVGGYGEPLIGRYTEDLLRLAAFKGCFIEIITSGVSINRHWAGLAETLPIGRFIISVDSSTENGMLKARGTSLKSILDRVHLLKKQNVPPKIAFNFTLNKKNLDDLPKLVVLAGENGVDSVYVAHQKIYTRAQKDDSALHDKRHLRAVFNDAILKAGGSNVELRLPPIEGTHECHQPLELMMIRSDGMTFACCSAMFGGGQARLELGRLNEKTLTELWNSPVAMNARARIFGMESEPSPCDQCAFRIFAPKAMERFLD